jgi:hypothetical protein
MMLTRFNDGSNERFQQSIVSTHGEQFPTSGRSALAANGPIPSGESQKRKVDR